MNSDDKLKCTLLEQLKRKLGDGAKDITILCVNGIVTLGGSVIKYPDKREVLKIVKQTAGVLAWFDELQIHLPKMNQCSDSEILNAATYSLNCVATKTIRVTAQNGWLFLAGMVKNSSQREAVEAAACCLPGIVGITNSIAVEPTCSTSSVH